MDRFNLLTDLGSTIASVVMFGVFVASVFLEEINYFYLVLSMVFLVMAKVERLERRLEIKYGI